MTYRSQDDAAILLFRHEGESVSDGRVDPRAFRPSTGGNGREREEGERERASDRNNERADEKQSSLEEVVRRRTGKKKKKRPAAAEEGKIDYIIQGTEPLTRRGSWP